MEDAKRWTVVSTSTTRTGVRAAAQLHDRRSDRLVGVGSAHLGPVERCDPEIGDQLATARAPRRLSQRLIEVAKDEFDHAAHEEFFQHRTWPLTRVSGPPYRGRAVLPRTAPVLHASTHEQPATAR